jgi:hypothetical protein
LRLLGFGLLLERLQIYLDLQPVPAATWQRCRLHWMRNALAHVRKVR